jgi:hypothetical protein
MSEIQPRPGGMVDTARQQAAQAQPEQTVTNADGPVSYQAVRVREEPPDLGTARTVTLSAANPVLTVLYADRQRRSAVIVAVDNDIYLSTDQGAANQVAGGASAEIVFYLPKGLPLPVANQAQLWAAATTTATSSRVSVLVSQDSMP